jgi:hypothetical protein
VADGQVVGAALGQHAGHEIGNVVGNAFVERRLSQHLHALLAPARHARIVLAGILRKLEQKVETDLEWEFPLERKRLVSPLSTWIAASTMSGEIFWPL